MSDIRKLEQRAKKCIELRGELGLGFTLSQATKALRENRGIALLYFRPLH